jgi:ribonucleoside-diphosphate reductase alpha chain
MDVGIPHEDEIHNPNDTVVFSFPQKAPEGAVTRDHLTALQHLDLWLAYRRHWCEHNPSITVTVREDEWVDVASWVYDHFDECAGVSFLPHSEHIYKQAPYQEIDELAYHRALESMPKSFDWKDLGFYEKFDTTSGAQELACVASSGACEVVDIAA